MQVLDIVFAILNYLLLLIAPSSHIHTANKHSGMHKREYEDQLKLSLSHLGVHHSNQTKFTFDHTV